MKRRILSGFIGLPVLAAFIIMGGPWLLVIISLLSAAAMAEFYKTAGVNRVFACTAGFTATGIYYLILADITARLVLLLISVFILITLIILVIFNTKITFFDCEITLFGFFYTTFLMSFIYLVRENNYGQFYVWLIVISAWGSDTGAFFSGKYLGRRPMPLGARLSPKKTLEGALGGIISAGLLTAVYHLINQKFIYMETAHSLFIIIILGILLAGLAQLGDLAASAIKRNYDIKDYGSIIPGHGGILDRFDSILFTAPGVYIFLSLFPWRVP